MKALALTVGLVLAAWYLNTGRGIPWMFALFVALVVAMDYAFTRTQWGRMMTAVGGNAEAARRAGINVKRIYVSAFVACAMFAALGGVLSSARLASASQQAGTGDVNLNAIAAAVIGGTSLFGGRGSAWSALLGIIVIQSIANGADAPQPVVEPALHDHRRRACRGGHRGQPRAPEQGVPWPGMRGRG